MSTYLPVVKKEFNFSPGPIQDDIALRKNKDFFWPNGTQVYVGRQGSGKTISAVRHVLRLMVRYPRSILVSNVDLKDFRPKILELTDDQQAQLLELNSRAADVQLKVMLKANLEALLKDLDPKSEYIRFSSLDELAAVLVGVNNDFYGVIYLIDEIHTYFNALDSKNIPMYVFTEISQQRKQRKVIIGTSQLFMRLAKPLREQCDNLIMCSTLGGLWTFQKAYAGAEVREDAQGNLMHTGLKKRGWFFHTRELRAAFDTFQKVVSGQEQYEAGTTVISVQDSGRYGTRAGGRVSGTARR